MLCVNGFFSTPRRFADCSLQASAYSANESTSCCGESACDSASTGCWLAGCVPVGAGNSGFCAALEDPGSRVGCPEGSGLAAPVAPVAPGAPGNRGGVPCGARPVSRSSSPSPGGGGMSPSGSPEPKSYHGLACDPSVGVGAAAASCSSCLIAASALASRSLRFLPSMPSF